MNSNTLFRIFGYFVISVCVFTIRATSSAAPPVASIGKPDRGIGGPTGVRGAIKPIIVPAIPEVIDDALGTVGNGFGFLPMDSLDGRARVDIFDEAEAAVADDPTIVTAELAKEAVVAQAKEADAQEKNATTAKRIAMEKAAQAKGGVASVQSAATKAEKASGEAKSAETATEALIKAEEARKEAQAAIDKAKIVQDAEKNAKAKANEADKAAGAAIVAANIAKARAKKADTLDKVPNKPTAKIANEKADAANKSAVAAKASSAAAAKSAVAANEAKTLVEKLVKEAEAHKEDAFAAAKAKEDQEKPPVSHEILPPVKEVIPPFPSVPSSNPTPTAPVKPSTTEIPTRENEKLPDKAKKAEMNYVKDEKYDYQAQLLKEDRCSDKDAKEIKCKKFSNCYLDHTKPICVCFPGYTSTDPTKTACKKVDKPTCKNDANTCHMNAQCKESKILGIGCQCKEDFSGDGLLCSSAFSYFMNFFLVLAIASVQLYM